MVTGPMTGGSASVFSKGKISALWRSQTVTPWIVAGIPEDVLATWKPLQRDHDLLGPGIADDQLSAKPVPFNEACTCGAHVSDRSIVKIPDPTSRTELDAPDGPIRSLLHHAVQLDAEIMHRVERQPPCPAANMVVAHQHRVPCA